MILFSLTDKAIAKELGKRIKQQRLNKDFSQKNISIRAGISITAVQGAEKGETTLLTIIKILRVLGALDQLNSFLPEPPISPIALAKLEGRKRQKASGKRG
jgi:putative transcriptional regulator